MRGHFPGAAEVRSRKAAWEHAFHHGQQGQWPQRPTAAGGEMVQREGASLAAKRGGHRERLYLSSLKHATSHKKAGRTPPPEHQSCLQVQFFSGEEPWAPPGGHEGQQALCWAEHRCPSPPTEKEGFHGVMTSTPTPALQWLLKRSPNSPSEKTARVGQDEHGLFTAVSMLTGHRFVDTRAHVPG